MMVVRMNPYLVMDGNAKEAIAFYEKALAAKVVTVQTFGEGPADPNHPMPDGVKDRIMHGMLKVGETELMFSDTFPGMPYQTGNNVNITIVTNAADSSKQVFDALADGGKVGMPLQETFWTSAYGQVTDKFGVSWQITTEANA
jgi:PhnB protein